MQIIPTPSHYHGDEGFYTNAAIRMVHTGDYWTPYYADGRPRFLKPILTYWAVAVPYRIFGINFFSSRIIFVVAGCLVFVLTGRLSLAFFQRPNEAFLSVLIAASNLQLLTLSIRSTPDILVILFVLISCVGFAQIIFRHDVSFLSFLLAYGGAGLAVQTKGLLGLFPVAFVLLFCAAWALRSRVAPLSVPAAQSGGTSSELAGEVASGTFSLRDLLHSPAILIGAAVALFWYVIVFWKNGRPVFSQFFSDQLTAKISFNPLFSLQNLAVYLFAAVRHFLPWTAILLGFAVARPGIVVESFARYRKQFWFILGAFLCLLLVFAFGNMRRTRYVAVSYPLLAVLQARLLSHFLESERLQLALARTLRWSAVTVGCLGVVLGFVSMKITSRGWITAALLLGMAIWLYSAARAKLHQTWSLAFASLLATSFLLIESICRPAFTFSPAPMIGAKLRVMSLPHIYVWDPRPSLLDQLRVCSHGTSEFSPIGKTNLPAAEFFTGPVIITAAQTPSLPGTNWTFEPAGFGSRKWSFKDLRRLLSASDPSVVLASNREPYFIARRAGVESLNR